MYPLVMATRDKYIAVDTQWQLIIPEAKHIAGIYAMITLQNQVSSILNCDYLK